MRKIADIAAYIFMVLVILLSIISILGIWEFFAEDVISKSFQSIGLLAVVAIIVIGADHLRERRSQIKTEVSQEINSVTTLSESYGTFLAMRGVTLSVLVASVALLALLGIMAIWEILDGVVLDKSLASIAVIAFSSLIIVVTCLEREDNPILKKHHLSGGVVFTFIIFLWFLMQMLMGSWM